jgi:hypothetical protein
MAATISCSPTLTHTPELVACSMHPARTAAALVAQQRCVRTRIDRNGLALSEVWCRCVCRTSSSDGTGHRRGVCGAVLGQNGGRVRKGQGEPGLQDRVSLRSSGCFAVPVGCAASAFSAYLLVQYSTAAATLQTVLFVHVIGSLLCLGRERWGRGPRVRIAWKESSKEGGTLWHSSNVVQQPWLKCDCPLRLLALRRPDSQVQHTVLSALQCASNLTPIACHEWPLTRQIREGLNTLQSNAEVWCACRAFRRCVTCRR